ncbi:unnamed protein product, partial [Phaeothamnion confervicola]
LRTASAAAAAAAAARAAAAAGATTGPRPSMRRHWRSGACWQAPSGCRVHTGGAPCWGCGRQQSTCAAAWSSHSGRNGSGAWWKRCGRRCRRRRAALGYSSSSGRICTSSARCAQPPR